MHEHNECEHDLRFCKKCNVVYCTKCKKEWNDHVPSYSFTYTSSPYTFSPCTITHDTGDPLPIQSPNIYMHT